MVQSVGWCVWITGLPGSGKSTIAQVLLEKLKKRGAPAQILSSDMLRRVITPKPTYTQGERDVVYAAVVFVAKLLTQNGVNVVIDATGNRRNHRDHARKELPQFLEAYVRCPLEICIKRESGRERLFHAPQEVYAKAFTGESSTVPGVGVPYETPLHPEVTVDSSKLDPAECAQRILETMAEVFRS
jgi:adenylylsulfate kinase